MQEDPDLDPHCFKCGKVEGEQRGKHHWNVVEIHECVLCERDFCDKHIEYKTCWRDTHHANFWICPACEHWLDQKINEKKLKANAVKKRIVWR